MDPRNLAGSLKAAILIQALDQQSAQTIFNSLGDQEKEVVKCHLSQMGQIPAELVEKVAQEFTQTVDKKKTTVTEKLKKPAAKKEEQKSEANKSLQAIKAIEPDRLAELIKEEHPQTIAIILVHLDTQTASEVLSLLPDELKSEVALRIATSDKVISGMVDEINKVFEDILANKVASETHSIGGIARLAEIINQTDEMSGDLILNEIEEEDPELVAEIKQKMFVFEDLVLVDDRGLQNLLRSVETRELALALKASTEDVKEKIFSNMSERAAEILMEEIEALGSVRMKEVSDAQKGITKLIQEKEAKGDLIISGRRGEEFIG